MSIRAVLKIAKSGKDLRDNDTDDMALYSPMFLPKIYAVKKVSPIRETEYDPTTLYYEHGMGYPPIFITYREQQYLMDNSGLGQTFNPVRYTFETGTDTVKQKMSSTVFTNEDCGWYSRDRYLILFLDPLENPTTAPSATSHNSPRLKIGEDLENIPDYSANIDTKYQTLKVYDQDEFVCNLPSSTLSSYSNEYTWFNFTHGLSYPPVFAPFGVDSSGINLNLVYKGDKDDIPTDLTVNDIVNKMSENRNWYNEYLNPTDDFEYIWLFVDSSKFYVGYIRLNSHATSITFPARTVRVNYTIFNLPINEEFNLLS